MLDETRSQILDQRSTGKEPLDDGDVRRLLASAQRVLIARGKSQRTVASSEVELTDLKGPTGKYRAPMLLVTGTLLVGFNREALDELVAS